MDGVSAVFAVVSLGVQLAGTIQATSDFLRSVQNAPDELLGLVDLLDQIQGTLGHVRDLIEQQSSVLTSPESLGSIAAALQNCEKSLKKLKSLVDQLERSLDRQHRIQRAWASLRTVLKKEELLELRKQIQESLITLQLSISINSAQLQLHQMQVTAAGSGLPIASIAIQPRPFSPEETDGGSSSEEISSHKPIARPDAQFVSKTTFAVLYSGVFGDINVQKSTKFTSRSRNSSILRRKAIRESKAIMVTPAFFKTALELRVTSSLGRVSRTINLYPMLNCSDPIFKICRTGDLQGLQVALSSGSVSPFVVDNYGQTLLHYAATSLHTELCTLLLQIGVDPDRTATFGQKALQRVGLPGNYERFTQESTESIVNTLRVLAESQDDFSASDISQFFERYMGPPEGAELMLSQEIVQLKLLHTDSDQTPFPPLATALRMYGAGMPQWEPLIRRLIRNGADLHAVVPRNDLKFCRWFTKQACYPCAISEDGTPLDELFMWTESIFEAESAGKGWVQMLADEGIDVRAYLDEEISLHKTPYQLTYPSASLAGYENPRQLVFDLGLNLIVSWDWWIDPGSSTHMLRKELRNMNLFVADWSLKSDGWENRWPFHYPPWADGYEPWPATNAAYPGWKRIRSLADKRAHKRTRKKAIRLAQAQGLKWSNTVPGAWIA